MAKVNKEVSTVYEIEDAYIVSVEKGSILSNPTEPVIAFTVDAKDNQKPIKVIVKNEKARMLWEHFLKDNATMEVKKPSCSTLFDILRETLISFKGDLKEERTKEIVLENIWDIEFKDIYSII